MKKSSLFMVFIITLNLLLLAGCNDNKSRNTDNLNYLSYYTETHEPNTLDSNIFFYDFEVFADKYSPEQVIISLRIDNWTGGPSRSYVVQGNS